MHFLSWPMTVETKVLNKTNWEAKKATGQQEGVGKVITIIVVSQEPVTKSLPMNCIHLIPPCKRNIADHQGTNIPLVCS